jgi:hypothetical protein
VQSDIYVDFNGNFVKCPLDEREGCQLNGAGASDLSVPANFRLIPGVLHSYRVSDIDLAGYVEPQKKSLDHEDEE